MYCEIYLILALGCFAGFTINAYSCYLERKRKRLGSTPIIPPSIMAMA